MQQDKLILSNENFEVINQFKVFRSEIFRISLY